MEVHKKGTTHYLKELKEIYFIFLTKILFKPFEIRKKNLSYDIPEFVVWISSNISRFLIRYMSYFQLD